MGFRVIGPFSCVPKQRVCDEDWFSFHSEQSRRKKCHKGWLILTFESVQVPNLWEGPLVVLLGLPTLCESSLETPFHIKPEVPFTDLQVEARSTLKINQHGSTSDNRYLDYALHRWYFSTLTCEVRTKCSRHTSELIHPENWHLKDRYQPPLQVTIIFV